MIGRLIRLAVTALLLLAVWRMGQAYFAHYQFTDELEQIASRGVRTDEAEVRGAVAEAAGRLGIPAGADGVQVRVGGEHVYIDVRYTRPIELLPRYRYPWSFSASVHGWVLPSGGIQPRR
jgi:hypothetical protein